MVHNLLSLYLWLEVTLISKLSTTPGPYIRHARIQESSWGGGGGPGQSDKKALTTFCFFFCFFFFCPQLILQKSNGQFQRKFSFFKIPEGVQHFPGGSNFFQGGSNCLFPIDTHITCNFPGGSGPPVPPLWIRTCKSVNRIYKSLSWVWG